MAWSVLIVGGVYTVMRAAAAAGQPDVHLLNGALVKDTPASVIAHLLLEDAGLPSGAAECDVVAAVLLTPQLDAKKNATVHLAQIERCIAEVGRTKAVA